MSAEKPEALRLADALETAEISYTSMVKAAAELRRLHASCEDYAQHKQRQDQRILTLTAQRDALLALLGRIRAWDMMDTAADGPHWKREIDAAIKAVEEGK